MARNGFFQVTPVAGSRPSYSDAVTERMRQVLEVLARNGGAMTCNEIGYACGFTSGMAGGRISHNGKSMGPANRVNFAVTALERRGLVAFGHRRDGLSGSAYRITDAGRSALRDGSA